MSSSEHSRKLRPGVFTALRSRLRLAGSGASTVGFALMLALLLPVSAQATEGFGIKPGTLETTYETSKEVFGVPQASSHPYSFTVGFKLNLEEGTSKSAGGELRDLVADLPPGFSGDPFALPRCTRQEFEGFSPKCAPNTQVGVIHVAVPGIDGAVISGPMYNMVPPPGVAAEIGFSASGLNGLQDFTVIGEDGEDEGRGERYGLRDHVSFPLEVTSLEATYWGVPGDKGHDEQRGTGPAAGQDGSTSFVGPEHSFLTLPAECSHPVRLTFALDSTLDPGDYLTQNVESLDGGGSPAAPVGCGAVPFSPSVAAQPTSRDAGAPSGLDFELVLPDEGLLNPGGVAETQPRTVSVALPEGLTANPSFAEGISGCSMGQYQAERLGTPPGGGCPETSKLGSVVSHSPLIDEPLEGSLYLAAPYQNQFGSLLAIYMVLRAPERGIIVKQAGHVVPNPVTGQLVTSFEGLPPLPYSTFHLHFREGARAPLATPSTCGQFKTVSQLTPFSSGEPVERDSLFTIDHGTDGGACPSGATPPFSPGLIAGTSNNAAGSYSPLTLRITRKDGEQELTGFATQLPEGLTAHLTGVPFCTEADIALARSKTGAGEQADPSCPAASQIGHSQVGVGVGTVLAYAPGKMYLGGPFEGAPFSVVSISAAKVGPFDLGTVVVHLPLDVDSLTGRVSIPQGLPDQIPHIIDGIVVHVRDIQVSVDREHFTLNPTSCEKKTISATVYGSGQDFSSPADDVPASTSTPFQAADCASLEFKPAFKVATSAKTSRKDGASLHVALSYPSGSLGKDANVRSVKVELPKLLPSRLTTLQKACPARQFEANPSGCPVASRVGFAKAITPILPVALEGPAYFVSYGAAKFPELVIVLQGDNLTIDLHGETFINEKTNITSSTFHAVPDQPVSSFELTLPQGPDSALGATGDLCTSALAMPTIFTAQNGARIEQDTPLEVQGCPYTLKILKHRVQKRTLTLQASVPAAGKLAANGKGVTPAHKSSKGRQTITLKIQERHPGRLHTNIRLRFTPNNTTNQKTRNTHNKTLQKNITITFH